MTKQDDRVRMRIPKELKAAAMAKAEAEGLTLSEALRRLLAKWTAKDPPPPEKSDA